jgi:hypothetical protein
LILHNSKCKKRAAEDCNPVVLWSGRQDLNLLPRLLTI